LKILITGGKSAVALKLLKAFEGDEVILADYGDVPFFGTAAYRFISLGEKNEETIAHNLLNHVLDCGADAVLPLHTFEIEQIAKTSILFSEFNVSIILPGFDKLQAYLKPTLKKDWIIINDGEVIYSSMFFEHSSIPEGINQLSGAFYITTIEDKLTLNLITI
jgi:hypothetical protein